MRYTNELKLNLRVSLLIMANGDGGWWARVKPLLPIFKATRMGAIFLVFFKSLKFVV